MNRRDSLKLLLASSAMATGGATLVWAQGRPRIRVHTATEAQAITLQAANRSAGATNVSIRIQGTRRVIMSNGIPNHEVGQFPNRGNPNRIRAQDYSFSMPLSPLVNASPSRGGRTLFGVGVNGVPFDPGTAEFWQGNRQSGWNYEALGGAVPLGLDASYGHVQPTGAYHYHGLPVGLMHMLGWSITAASPLIGYAADGFPIYAMTAEIDGRVKKMQSSYRLRSGARPGGSQPGGRYDGAFTQDYAYVAGSGDLDECNGAYVTSEDYPDGTYAYFLTDSFPVIPRLFRATPDRSFSMRRP